MKLVKANAGVAQRLKEISEADDAAEAGAEQALEQNRKYSKALHKALEDFDAWWTNAESMKEEGADFAKKNKGATKKDVADQCTATLGCFLKYLKVPEGTPKTIDTAKGTDGYPKL